MTRDVRVLLLERDAGLVRRELARGGFEVELLAASTQIGSAYGDLVVVAFAEVDAADASVVAEVSRSAGAAPVLVTSLPVATDTAMKLLKAGASGYLFSTDWPRLADAVRTLMQGGVALSDPISQLVLHRARRSSSKLPAVQPLSDDSVPLTLRQRQILDLLQSGHSYQDIGSALGISLNTVRSHLRVIYERLGATTKVEAVVAGLERGLITSPAGAGKK